MFSFLKKPSRARFAATVIARIKEAGGPDFTLDLEKFEIRHGTTRGFLGNTYDAYCHARGAHRDAVLNNFVSAFVAQRQTSEISFEEAEPDIVTVIRERALFSFSSLHWQLEQMEGIPQELAEPVSRWFAKTAVIDSPGFMSLVNQDHATRWHQLGDEIFALGLQKLRASTSPRFTESEGVFRGQWHDDYDSSRILVPEVFADLPIQGDPVVVIPNRLTLLVTGSENTDAIRRMLQTAEEIVRSEPRRQNPAPLVLRNGEIHDFFVDPLSPVFNDVERAHRLAALLYYDEQKEKLEKLYEQNGKEIFVGSYILSRHDDGRHCSYSSVTKGVPTLLAVTDEVMFMDLDLPKDRQCVAQAPWPVVLERLPDLFLDTRMFPTRYYVSQFPTAEQLEKLR